MDELLRPVAISFSTRGFFVGQRGERRGRALRTVPVTVSHAVVAYGHALLDADVDRIGEVHALGLNEILF